MAEIAGKIIQKTLCFFLLFFLFSSQMLAEAAPLEVKWKGCLLSVKAEGVPLSIIIREISSQTGLRVSGSEQLEKPVTIHFSNLTLHEGLKKLLAYLNYTLLLEKSTPDGDLLPTLLLVVGSTGNGIMSIDIISSEEDNYLQILDRNTRLLRIMELLRTTPDQAVEVLRDATVDNDIDIRHLAFQQLSQMTSDKGLPAIKVRLDHPDPEIRMMAIEAMASKGEEYALEVALSALNDSEESVRNMAEGILHELEENEGIMQELEENEGG